MVNPYKRNFQWLGRSIKIHLLHVSNSLNIADTSDKCLERIFAEQIAFKETGFSSTEKPKLALNCEMCDFKAQTKHFLKFHLVTCEINKYGKC